MKMIPETDLKRYLTEVEKGVSGTPRTAPAQRNLFKQKFAFAPHSPSEQLMIWDYIRNHSSDLWTGGHSFFYLESKIKDKKFLVESWATIKNWQKKVDHWGYCDALSKIYTKILELRPDEVLEQLEQWNQSPSLWDRRQSLISLLYFSRTKKTILPFATIIRLINRLLEDNEYYVQKAVGWSLKECYRVYPGETLFYLENNITKISPVAFTAATEKYEKEVKKRLKKMRTSGRAGYNHCEKR